MTYTNEQKKIARDKLKTIGYKLSIKTGHSPFSGNAFEFIFFVTPTGQKVPCLDHCTCFSVEFYNTHKAAFEIVNEVFEPTKKVEKKA
jgi:hypothetical protein